MRSSSREKGNWTETKELSTEEGFLKNFIMGSKEKEAREGSNYTKTVENFRENICPWTQWARLNAISSTVVHNGLKWYCRWAVRLSFIYKWPPEAMNIQRLFACRIIESPVTPFTDSCWNRNNSFSGQHTVSRRFVETWNFAYFPPLSHPPPTVVHACPLVIGATPVKRKSVEQRTSKWYEKYAFSFDHG